MRVYTHVYTHVPSNAAENREKELRRQITQRSLAMESEIEERELRLQVVETFHIVMAYRVMA